MVAPPPATHRPAGPLTLSDSYPNWPALPFLPVVFNFSGELRATCMRVGAARTCIWKSHRPPVGRFGEVGANVEHADAAHGRAGGPGLLFSRRGAWPVWGHMETIAPS